MQGSEKVKGRLTAMKYLRIVLSILLVLAMAGAGFLGVRAMMSDPTTLPVVSANAGEAPTITAPKGAAPKELTKSDVIVGTGAEVLPTSTLTVHYTLMAWSTGKIIESSWSGQPATFPLANVVEGWQKGLPGAKVGGRRLLILPPEMGYGAAGAGPIGPNETLIFVVDIIGVA
jgi:peptidylprolyl isomerase